MPPNFLPAAFAALNTCLVRSARSKYSANTDQDWLSGIASSGSVAARRAKGETAHTERAQGRHQERARSVPASSFFLKYSSLNSSSSSREGSSGMMTRIASFASSTMCSTSTTARTVCDTSHSHVCGYAHRLTASPTDGSTGRRVDLRAPGTEADGHRLEFGRRKL